MTPASTEKKVKKKSKKEKEKKDNIMNYDDDDLTNDLDSFLEDKPKSENETENSSSKASMVVKNE